MLTVPLVLSVLTACSNQTEALKLTEEKKDATGITKEINGKDITLAGSTASEGKC